MILRSVKPLPNLSGQRISREKAFVVRIKLLGLGFGGRIIVFLANDGIVPRSREDSKIPDNAHPSHLRDD